MEIPSSRKREFHEKEVAFIKEAIRVSGIDASLVEAAWDVHSVGFNGVVQIEPVLFDCHGLMDTPCWVVRRLATQTGRAAHKCSCGLIVRESAAGAYGDLQDAVAAALAEVVRARVLAQTVSEPIFKEHHDWRQAPGCNDFMTHCMHS